MLSTSTAVPHAMDTPLAIIYMIDEIYMYISCLWIFSCCILVGLLRLYYKWYIALSVEQWLEKMKRERKEWKREVREQEKQQREIVWQGKIRRERLQNA